ncbi:MULTISPECIES: hypothetical protein [Phyllobacteriaceae]|jgi:hypothetical protein|uniref:Uncharacterized protein n=1 Tax=Mesorhizobium hungaricum TaxID=1566387 RepID=A0A1C2DD49_9HYPH|nr:MULTISPECIES: hypothetical protein [Mesorhizobium]MBN9235121.1 hypothetical protein [Mesorhizobium sp.]OCX12680.1 hypothetical protein QV13_24085 [Mesorhizobium hungaricum]
MSHLQELLDREGRLELHEISDLRLWLDTLRDDCAFFGSTPEDDARIARIQAKIDANQPLVQ